MRDQAVTNPPAFAPRRLGHANLFVSELERSLAFYRDVCGLCEVFREPTIRAGFLSNGHTHHDIGLIETREKPLVGRDGKVQNTMARGARPGLNHLAFEMASQKALIEGFERALGAGVAVERALDHTISRSTYLHDPADNVVEFYADAVEDWRAFYADHENRLISARWDPLAAERIEEDLAPTPGPPDRVPTAPLHPARIARASFRVAALEPALAFYRSTAGLRVLHHDRAERWATLACPTGDYCVALVEADGTAAAGLDHLGFDLAARSAPDAVAGRLADAGIAVLATAETPFQNSVTIADPDGIRLRFYCAPPAHGAAPVRADLLA